MYCATDVDGASLANRTYDAVPTGLPPPSDSFLPRVQEARDWRLAMADDRNWGGTSEVEQANPGSDPEDLDAHDDGVPKADEPSIEKDNEVIATTVSTTPTDRKS